MSVTKDWTPADLSQRLARKVPHGLVPALQHLIDLEPHSESIDRLCNESLGSTCHCARIEDRCKRGRWDWTIGLFPGRFVESGEGRDIRLSYVSRTHLS